MLETEMKSASPPPRAAVISPPMLAYSNRVAARRAQRHANAAIRLEKLRERLRIVHYISDDMYTSKKKKVNYTKIAKHFDSTSKTISRVWEDRDNLEYGIPGPHRDDPEIPPDLEEKVVDVVGGTPRPPPDNQAEATGPERPTILSTLTGVVKGATKELYIAGVSFTDDELGQSVLDAATSRVRVKICLDYTQARKYPKWPRLFIESNMIEVNFRTPISYQMHTKYLVADRLQVCVGSANFLTNALEKDSEELVLHLQGRRVASYFTVDFEYRWLHGSQCFLKKHLEKPTPAADFSE